MALAIPLGRGTQKIIKLNSNEVEQVSFRCKMHPGINISSFR